MVQRNKVAVVVLGQCVTNENKLRIFSGTDP